MSAQQKIDHEDDLRYVRKAMLAHAPIATMAKALGKSTRQVDRLVAKEKRRRAARFRGDAALEEKRDEIADGLYIQLGPAFLKDDVDVYRAVAADLRKLLGLDAAAKTEVEHSGQVELVKDAEIEAGMQVIREVAGGDDSS